MVFSMLIYQNAMRKQVPGLSYSGAILDCRIAMSGLSMISKVIGVILLISAKRPDMSHLLLLPLSQELAARI